MEKDLIERIKELEAKVVKIEKNYESLYNQISSSDVGGGTPARVW